ncbi:DUF1819 family protein [Lewinella cohaerens]|uniref:DUF1819 family protein n=1 Tax=Lewinella cohaerens TaxID=70995 RepID=UPI000361517D|nr:DUF1819 family protein [Lewinella cohaerens]
MVSSKNTYSFSFTAASMKFHDFVRLARFAEEEDPGTDLDPDKIMRRSNTRTNQREFRELLKRFQLLTPAQQALLTQVDPAGQKQLALLSICKAYAFMRDFIIEVVREKYLSLDYQLTDADWQSFFNRKLDLHPELEDFAPSTIKKARQVSWRMLEQAGLIESTKNRRILPQFVATPILRVVSEDQPDLLKIFLLPEQEINTWAA